MFSIPTRSPDLNPIENFFNLVNRKLQTDVVVNNIETETFQEFSTRVQNTLTNFNVETIDKIIETMDKRIHEILKCKGQQLKY